MALEDDVLSIDPYDGDDGGQPGFDAGETSANDSPPSVVVGERFGYQGSSGSQNDADNTHIVNQLLASAGIDDPTKVKFDDGNGVVERNWNDLSRDDKIGIINTITMNQDINNLTDDEREFLNMVRQDYGTLNNYFNVQVQQRNDDIRQTQLQNYDIDGIDDDELFVLDALDRYGEENISDEELEKLLVDAKSTPELYAKTVNALRSQYKQKEDELKYRQQEMERQQAESDFNDFSGTILDEIQNLNNMRGVQLNMTVDDMNDLANFILTKDDTGNSEFGLAMNNPRVFTQAAFWVRRGPEILAQIPDMIKRAYDNGVAAGRGGKAQLMFGNSKRDVIGPAAPGASAETLDVY